MTNPAAAAFPYAEFDGRPATEDDLRTAALFPYGHFTAMQIRDGRVRGLDLHLERLGSANRELFELPLDGGPVRELVRHALRGAGVADASVRVVGTRPPGATGTTVMVTVREPARMTSEPRSLMSVPYARTAPHLKRPGDFGQMYYGDLARRAGFDDALLTLPDGAVTEGSITNIGFWDGTSVIWPQAPALLGITMALLERELPGTGVRSLRRPVTKDGLAAYRSAFVTNSQGMAPVARIDDTVFTVDEELMKRLGAAYEAAPWDTV
ncbi:MULTISPECIES: aminotransferase class IV family protein [unclassified Streptomyces]|uniref:aminotransferase class IV family protein n=1 Tax=unclassified Streptomyces TaxID=2593676 RepID=UPI00224D4274|nr:MULTISPECIES: aminotransferase class IV family protein [unclassified Streptomyces]MCX5140125.1 aminotransferase class IV family protein [Streptomyces sp. NBC_00338]WRZ64722.1 aminotransferase class IV family protein [Streptomyces sp. NBC_01257]